MSTSLEALPKGHRFPQAAFNLSPAWVREYVSAVEDEAIGDLGPGLVPPMALAALALRALLQGAELPPGAIHLGQEAAFLRPVRVGESLSVEAEIVHRGERRGWVLMNIDLRIEAAGGEPVMTGRTTVTMPHRREVQAGAP